MAAIAISLLWLLIGAICLAGVIYLLIYGIETFISPIPAKLKQGVWFIFLLLIVIYLIGALAGGGGANFPHPFR